MSTPTPNETTDPLDIEEAYLKDRLVELQRRYQDDAKPYVDRLVRIAALRPPIPWTITRAQAEAAGIDWSRLEGKMK